MPWQQHVADVALEIDRDTGRFAYREIVLTVPRRSGKSALLLAVLIHRMIAMGEGQVAAFTMQNGLQARMRLRREWLPLLKRSKALHDVFDPSMFTGAEALIFANGSRLEVSAGTSSSGHGATLDLAVVDEAFDQPDDRLEQAFRPAIRTQPNAQLWWVSTAGSPDDVWFRAKVESARLGTAEPTGTAIFEWSAADDADAADPAVWWECMPALGFVRANGSGLTEADIAEEYRAMTRTGNEDGFRRAYLNQWVSKQTESAIDVGVWLALAGSGVLQDPVSFSVEVPLDRSRAVIGVAGGSSLPGRTQLEVAHTATGTDWVVNWLVRNEARSVVVDGAAEAASLTPALEAAGVAVVKVNGAQRAQACATFFDLLMQGGLTHLADPRVTSAVGSAVWKETEGARTFSRRRSAGDITELYALLLALRGLVAAPAAGGWMLSL